MAEPHDQVRLMRKSFACDECKRRKIRCSGGDCCTNCSRDLKQCQYSSPSQRLVSLQRRFRQSQENIATLKRAWKIHLPNTDLESAIRDLPKDSPDEGSSPPSILDDTTAQMNSTGDAAATDMTDMQDALVSPVEPTNAEEYEFDESKDAEGSIDGMAFLTADPHKAGYTGPQSGIAALKFLRSLPPYLPISRSSPLTASEDQNVPEAHSFPVSEIRRYIDDYFSLYHPAYPILHEGTFRARHSGAVPKPKDGSWPLLYNSVLAIGAFVGGPNTAENDLPFFNEIRKHLSMDILEKGSLGYVQAITLIANYLQKRNKPNAGFILIGISFSMALSIGLHREFDTHSAHNVQNTTPFLMEIRRRVWWTLFVFMSGAQLALGRPSASLVGVNVHLPANLDDMNLAVDMEDLPPESLEPTAASCLIEQIKLAKVANAIHDELLTHRRPSYATAMNLEHDIRQWCRSLPWYLDENHALEPRLEFPKRVLLWRSSNLRIVLNRPFLFENIASGAPLDDSFQPIRSCLEAANECIRSISGFVNSMQTTRRGFAWYTTAWLITAGFVQATCLIYSPSHKLSPGWKNSLLQTVDCLQLLGSSLDIALRAREVLQNVLENPKFQDSSLRTTFNPISGTRSGPDFNNENNVSIGENQRTVDLSSLWYGDRFLWAPPDEDSLEILGAAGSLVHGNVFDVS